jgi:creatinine amidohydrolase
MKDIVRSCYGQGLKNFIILSGHAGGSHRMALQDAGEELIAEIKDVTIAILTEFELARKAGAGFIETEQDLHAGEIETSRIMNSHPHLVKGEGQREFPDFPAGLLVRDKRKYWQNGVWGDPTKATAVKGKQLEESVVARIVELVQAMEKTASSLL